MGPATAITLADLDEAILPLVQRPGRYVPAIRGLISRPPAAVTWRAAVAAPDLLDSLIMEPLVSVLYYGLHDLEGAAADLVFQPAPDFEQALRAHGLPLASLGWRRPLADFDLVIIPVTTELQATGVLALLELGGVVLRAAERDASAPLVVGVGPGLVNPEPLAPFFDAIVVGDAEPALADLGAAAARRQAAGGGRAAALELLAATPGIYVPARVPVVSGEGGLQVAAAGTPPVRARIRDPHQLDSRRLQPLIDVRDDAVRLEVMRGCPRQCRFCQPARSGGPPRAAHRGEVRRVVRELAAAGGWAEFALAGLMPGDWPELRTAAEEIGRDLMGTGAGLSLAAASGEALNRPLLGELGRMRRTALHIAPEAGSERLRRLIGKPLDLEALTAAVRQAASFGWPGIRLHFMVGLPTETREDLDAIVALTVRLRAAAKRPGHAMQLHLMVHPFIPRAGTPLQWAEQLDPTALEQRLRYLRQSARKVVGRLKWRRPEVTEVEGLLARGDRRVAEVIETAYRLGARLDGWNEHHRPLAWQRALAAAGLDAATYRGRRPAGAPLPWSHLEHGTSEAVLAREHQAALGGQAPPPALGPAVAAAAAAAVDGVADQSASLSGEATGPRRCFGRSPKRWRGPARASDAARPVDPAQALRYRVRYAKTAPVRFISHLDLVRAFDRALRRAGLYVAYSTGYSRHPRFSFGPPLAVGMVGRDEYFDVEFAAPPGGDCIERLNRAAPAGIELFEARPILGKVESLMSLIDHADYGVRLPDCVQRLIGDARRCTASLGEAIQTFLSHERAYVIQRGPHGERPVEIRAGVRRLELVAGDSGGRADLRLSLRLAGEGAVRPLDLMGFLLGEQRLDPRLLRVERTRLYGLRGDQQLRPFDAISAIGPAARAPGPAASGQAGGGRLHVQGNRDQRRSSRDQNRHPRRW